MDEYFILAAIFLVLTVIYMVNAFRKGGYKRLGNDEETPISPSIDATLDPSADFDAQIFPHSHSAPSNDGGSVQPGGFEAGGGHHRGE